MRAFIRIQHSGDFYDQNCYSVYHGCSKLDIPIVRYKAIYSVTDNAPTDLVVGAFSDVKVALERLGVILLPIDYPDELLPLQEENLEIDTIYDYQSSRLLACVCKAGRRCKTFSRNDFR